MIDPIEEKHILFQQKLLEITCSYFRCSIDEVTHKGIGRASQRVGDARKCISGILRQYKYSLNEIGAVIGISHGAVLYNINKFNTIYETDRVFSNTVAAIVKAHSPYQIK